MNDIAHALLPPTERPDVLVGVTQKIKAPNVTGQMINIYLTVNEKNGRPYEVFLNCSDHSIMELVSVSMVLISKMLRLGVSLDAMAEDLEQIYSANTAHMAGKTWCPSLMARIGRALKEHNLRRQGELNLESDKSGMPRCQEGG